MSKEKENTQAAPTAKDAAPVYTAAELAGASERIFGVSPEITIAALRVAGVDAAPIAEADKIIKEFANKEVK